LHHDRLLIVWLSGDKSAAREMAMLYARNCLLNCWFKQVRFFIWGPTVQLAASDPAIQTEIAIMQQVGVDVVACMACASAYGVVADLRAQGIPVRGLGEELSCELACGTPTLMV
jgi:hypothetical protein